MKGVLLVNLGSPDSCDVKDVKKYLGEFLMDRRVIDKNWIFRNLLVKGIILRTRPPQTANNYKKVWTKEGSPLIVLSEKLRGKVAAKVKYSVEMGMRYGKPSIFDGIHTLIKKGVTDIKVIPLYPQFAMSTTETVEVEARKVVNDYFPWIKINFHPPFYNDKVFLDLYADFLRPLINKNIDHFIFSYHGLPERHIFQADPTNGHCKIDGDCCKIKSIAHHTCYRHQCFYQTWEIAKRLNIKEKDYTVAFQSRLGKEKWLEPSITDTIQKLAKTHTSIAVFTPSFVTDCLETLEEIALGCKEDFLKLGGKHFQTLPCLNLNQKWVDLIVNWINE